MVDLLEDAALADVGLDEDGALGPHFVQSAARALVEAVDALLAVDAAALRGRGLVHRACLVGASIANRGRISAVRRLRLADSQQRCQRLAL